ncbi:MAG: hypothetical protein ACRDWT_19910 [Jatrophihabitantaceae bacterium]
MSRRASLPGAAELFRTTSAVAEPEPAPAPAPHPGVGAVPAPTPLHEAQDGSSRPRAVRPTRRVRSVADRSPSGRERHEEKITVYCSPEELLDLETARLHLRAEHGIAIDRGRIVREAIAVIIADFEAKGDASILVRRLRES